MLASAFDRPNVQTYHVLLGDSCKAGRSRKGKEDYNEESGAGDQGKGSGLYQWRRGEWVQAIMAAGKKRIVQQVSINDEDASTLHC